MPDAKPPRASLVADLGPRLISAAVMIAAALGTTFAGGNWFAAFWILTGLAVHWEWQRLIGGGNQPVRFALGAIVLAATGALASAALPDIAAGLVVLAALGMAVLAGPGRRLWAAGGVFYAGILVGGVCLLRGSTLFGLHAILWLYAIVWGTDIMAYFGGRLIGGPKLWPRVSPRKTWAGFLTGTICGALAGLAVAIYSGAAIGGAYALILLAGFVLAVASQGGDLFESAMKRHFGVKDSSALIPGHGGVMDRLDGFIVAAGLAALFGVARAGMAAPALGLFHW